LYQGKCGPGYSENKVRELIIYSAPTPDQQQYMDAARQWCEDNKDVPLECHVLGNPDEYTWEDEVLEFEIDKHGSNEFTEQWTNGDKDATDSGSDLEYIVIDDYEPERVY
jgi:hypothetical protein